MKILLKRSDTTGSIPSGNQLMYGELAVNTADGKLFTKTTDGSVVQLGTVTQSPSLPVGTIVPAINNAFQVTDYLPCTGGTYSKTSYSGLAALLGDSYQRSGTHSYINASTQAMTYVSGIFTVYPNTSLVRYANESNLNTWTNANLGVVKIWTGVEFIRNSGILCGVTSTDSTIIRSSTSGTSWTVPTTTGMVSYNHTAACSGNNKACVVTNGPTSLTTTDGSIFDIGTMPSGISRNWQGVAWNGSVFCAVAYGTNIAATSSNGLSWIQQSLPATGNWAAIAWNGSVFCTVSAGSNVAATSTDGSGWTLRSMSATGNWTGIGYHSGVGKFLAVSSNQTGCLSSDGISWTNTTLPLSGTVGYKNVVSDGNQYMVGVTTFNGPIVVTSPDGVTWTERAYAANPNRYGVLDYRPTGVWACTVSTNGALWSTNSGISWTVATIGVNIQKSYVVWTGSAFLYGCNSPSLNTSTTGSGNFITTTTGFNPAFVASTTNNSDIVAINTNGRLVSRSTNTGLTWNNYGLPQSASWSGVAYGSGTYCAVATGTTAAYSYDGTGWYQSTLPTGQLWSAVCYSANKFIAVANGSNIAAASYDGVNWFKFTLPANYAWKTIKAASDGTTVIIPTNNTVMATASDGLSYKIYNVLTSTISPTTFVFGSGNTRIIVAGTSTEANSIVRDTGNFTVPYIYDILGNYVSGISLSQKFYIKT